MHHHGVRSVSLSLKALGLKLAICQFTHQTFWDFPVIMELTGGRQDGDKGIHLKTTT